MNGVVEFTWTERAKPIVEIGIGDSRVATPSVARWDLSNWDDPASTWTGDEPLWQAVTGDAHRVDYVLGRKRATDAFEEGRATIVVSNESGWADPTPIDDPTALALRAGRAIRIGIDHAEIGIVWQFRGYIDTIVPRYDPEFADVVDIGAVCALGESGRAAFARLAVPVGDGELASTRMVRILDAAKWPATLRSIEETGVALLATELGAQAADLMGVTADSAGGVVFGDELGRVAFRSRYWQTYNPAIEPDGIIGNGHTIGHGAFHFPESTSLAANYMTVPLATPVAPDVVYAVECVRPPIPPAGHAYNVTGNPFALRFTSTGVVATIRLDDGSQLSTPTVTYATLEDAGFPAVGEWVQLVGVFKYLDAFVFGWRPPGPELDDFAGWNGAASVDATGLEASHTATPWYLGASTSGAADAFVGDVRRFWLDTTGLQVDLNADTDIVDDGSPLIATTGQAVTVFRAPTEFLDWEEVVADDDLMAYTGAGGDWTAALADLYEWTG